jgi:chorismate mutase-like protein
MTEEAAWQALAALRTEIDAIDGRIVQLLNDRARIAGRIGDTKQAAGLPVVEPAREQKVVEKVCGMNGGPLTNAAVQAIYEKIMLEMRQIQFERMQAKG